MATYIPEESGRVPINPIPGQVGVASGSGAVGATTQRVTLATDVALPAGTNLLGRVASSHETGTVYNATTAITPEFAFATATASGNTQVVALDATKKIRVLAGWFTTSADVNVKFQSATTDKTAPSYLAANGGVVLPFNPVGWFETAASAALNVNLSGTANVGVTITYIKV